MSLFSPKSSYRFLLRVPTRLFATAYKTPHHLPGYCVSSWPDGLLLYPSLTILQHTGVLAFQTYTEPVHLSISVAAILSPWDTFSPAHSLCSNAIFSTRSSLTSPFKITTNFFFPHFLFLQPLSLSETPRFTYLFHTYFPVECKLHDDTDFFTFYSLLYPQHPEQLLAHNQHLINIYWIMSQWSNCECK